MKVEFSISHAHSRPEEIKEITACRCKHWLRVVVGAGAVIVLARTGHLPPAEELLQVFA